MTGEVQSDGGYYAIKGFAYQIDKTILDILDSTDENTPINIEQIQDIDSTDFVTQVKYKENAKFVPSIIKDPVVQLIEEFKRDKTKKYILYAYFGDMNGYAEFVNENKQISIEKLNQILGDKKDFFSVDEKTNFILNFNLDFSPEFNEQFLEIITKLKLLDFVGDSDYEAILFYSNIVNILTKKITDNSIEVLENRSCTKKEVLDIIKNRKKLVFSSSFREYKGDQQYYKFVKKEHFSHMNMDDFERFFVIELNGSEDVSRIKDVIIKLKNKNCKFISNFRRKRLTGGAPYIYLKNISNSNLKQLKTELLSEGVILNDGYRFKDADFSLNSIKIASTPENKLCLKILNTETELLEVIKSDLSKTKEVYQFILNTNSYVEIEEDIKNIEIQIQNISDIDFII